MERGVVVAGDNVYVGTLDGYLVALDAQSGTERWTVPVADNADGYSITAAPLAVDGRIIEIHTFRDGKIVSTQNDFHPLLVLAQIGAVQPLN